MVLQVATSEQAYRFDWKLVTNKYAVDDTSVVSEVNCNATTCYLSGMPSHIIRGRRA